MFFPFGNMGRRFGGDDDDDEPSAPEPSKPVDTERFYKLLEVDKTATQADIKKAFRRLAVTHHPDKGGDADKFKDLTKAYEVLSDDEKRQLYDKYGEEGVENGGPSSSGGAADLFDILSGRRPRGPGGKSAKRRGEDVVFPLKVSLEDLFNGTVKKLKLTKNVICTECAGKGGKADAVQSCKSCRGQGVKIMVRQLGPGMIQQMQVQCTECNGEGRVIAEKDKCGTCKGVRTTKEKKTLEVFVNRGMKHNEKIVFNGEADEAPDTEAGNVVVVLQQKEHPVFTRDGNHLFMKKTISLAESLCGFEFRIQHLTEPARYLLVKSAPGSITKPGDFKAIMGEGMPHARNQFSKGNLYIEFMVEFPKNGALAENTIKLLKKILPVPEVKQNGAGPSAPSSSSSSSSGVDSDSDTPKPTPSSSSDMPVDPEECVLADVDINEERRRFTDSQDREAYAEDDDEHPRHGGGGPTCRQA